MGVCGLAYASATSIPVAIVLVMISGFFNSPASVARSVLLQRNTPRDMRGRVFSAYYVMRDVIFLFGMAGAGLADVINVRVTDRVRLGPAVRGGALRAVRAGPGHPIAARRAGAARGGGGAGAHGDPAPTRDARRFRSAGRPTSRRSPGSTRRSARRSSATRRSARSRPARGSSSTATARRPRTSSWMARPPPASRRTATTADSRRCARATSSARSPR